MSPRPLHLLPLVVALALFSAACEPAPPQPPPTTTTTTAPTTTTTRAPTTTTTTTAPKTTTTTAPTTTTTTTAPKTTTTTAPTTTTTTTAPTTTTTTAPPRPAPCSAGYVALTFDDGPDASPAATALVLDQLKAKQTKATFFLVGRQIEWWPQLARRVAAEGHDVANHTYDHPDLRTLTAPEVERQFVRTNEVFAAAGLPKPWMQRPPFGGTDATIEAIGEAAGLTQVMWNVDPRDWENPGAAEIRKRIREKVKPNTLIVILLHDGWTEDTGEAVPGIIDDLRALGYCFGLMKPSARMEPGIGKIEIVPEATTVPPTTTTTVPPTTTTR